MGREAVIDLPPIWRGQLLSAPIRFFVLEKHVLKKANVFGSAFLARALRLKRITDNVLTYCSTEHVTNVMCKLALSTIHPGLDFQTLSISIDRSTLVLESLQASNPGGLGGLSGSEVRGAVIATAGPIRKLTNLESWRLGGLSGSEVRGAVIATAGPIRKPTQLESWAVWLGG